MPNIKEIKLDPLICWAGGKRWLKNVVAEFDAKSKSEIFVEPFAGGMACALHMKKEKTIINDINHHLINLYKHVANNININSLDYDTTDYNRNKSRFNDLIDTTDMTS